MAYCLAMTTATAFGLGSIRLIEALAYPGNSKLDDLAGLHLTLLVLSILLTGISLSLLPFLLVRWVIVRLLPRGGWVGAASAGGLASLARLLNLDYALYGFAMAEPPGGAIIYAMAFACGMVAGLVYRALGNSPIRPGRDASPRRDDPGWAARAPVGVPTAE